MDGSKKKFFIWKLKLSNLLRKLLQLINLFTIIILGQVFIY